MTDSSDIDALREALAAAEARAADAEAEACNAVAKVSDAEAQIVSLKLMVEKLRRALFGQRSERKQRLLDQMELQLDELEASATEDELAAEQAAAGTTQVKGFTRCRPARKPFPEHLPRERVVVPAPTACECCGSQKLSKIGEDITETLEVIPRQWKEWGGSPTEYSPTQTPPCGILRKPMSGCAIAVARLGRDKAVEDLSKACPVETRETVRAFSMMSARAGLVWNVLCYEDRDL